MKPREVWKLYKNLDKRCYLKESEFEKKRFANYWDTLD